MIVGLIIHRQAGRHTPVAVISGHSSEQLVQAQLVAAATLGPGICEQFVTAGFKPTGDERADWEQLRRLCGEQPELPAVIVLDLEQGDIFFPLHEELVAGAARSVGDSKH